MKIIRKFILLLISALLLLQTPALANTVTGSAVKLQEQSVTNIQLDLSRAVAYIVSGTSGFSVIDIQSTNTPQIAQLDLPEGETVSSMRLNDRYVYLIAKNSLYTIDISDSANPVLSGNVPIIADGTPAGFEIDADRIYIYDRNNIHVFSLMNPALPLFLKTVAVNDPVSENGITDIAVRNGIIYTASGYDGMQIFDFTDINHVMRLGRLNDIQGFCRNVNFAGEFAFINISGVNAAEVLDISSITNPRLTGVIQEICYDRSDYEIETLENRILLPDESNKIHLIDTSDLKNIKRTGWIDIEGIPAYIKIKEDCIYIFNTNGEMSIRKISDFKSVESGNSNPKTIPENSKDNKPIENSGNSDGKTAYITIDDGPSRNNTPKNLDTLKKYGVKATFFVLPNDNLDDIYKRIIEEGHLIGNHGCVHDYTSLYGSMEYFKKDVTKARDFIYKKFSYTSAVYRFPGGSMGHKQDIIKPRADLLGELGYRYFNWDVSTADTDPNLRKYGNEEKIVNLLANNVIKGARNKKKLIILMHDSAGKTYSAKALPKIIEGLQKQGYAFDVLTNY